MMRQLVWGRRGTNHWALKTGKQVRGRRPLKTGRSNLHAFNAQNVAGAADIRPMAPCTIVGAEDRQEQSSCLQCAERCRSGRYQTNGMAPCTIVGAEDRHEQSSCLQCAERCRSGRYQTNGMALCTIVGAEDRQEQSSCLQCAERCRSGRYQTNGTVYHCGRRIEAPLPSGVRLDRYSQLFDHRRRLLVQRRHQQQIFAFLLHCSPGGGGGVVFLCAYLSIYFVKGVSLQGCVRRTQAIQRKLAPVANPACISMIETCGRSHMTVRQSGGGGVDRCQQTHGRFFSFSGSNMPCHSPLLTDHDHATHWHRDAKAPNCAHVAGDHTGSGCRFAV